MKQTLFSSLLILLFLFGCQSTTNTEEQKSQETTSDNGLYDTTSVINKGYKILAWNDLGMHCLDKDYSIFSILPPYNNLVAQVVKTGKEPDLLKKDEIIVTFQTLNAKNTTSISKTNFWDYVKYLFGVNLPKDEGLKGFNPPQTTAQVMHYDAKYHYFIAEGIPLTPINDDNSTNHYPLVEVKAKDQYGNVLATTTTVLPVSDEMDCKKCHASKSLNNAKPEKGWVNYTNQEKDYRLNILRLHDEKFPDAVSEHQDALILRDYNYSKDGLEKTALSGIPILCAACHQSNALKTPALVDVKPLTSAIHLGHKDVMLENNITLSDSTSKSACYSCHPGQSTQCLRGVMGSNNIECQNCHGTIQQVGDIHRMGWLNEPQCDSCHQNRKRYTTVFKNDDIKSGILREVLDTTFSTNQDIPINNTSLYKMSHGHGKLQCSACHGSTHAIYPSSQKEDNLQSIAFQGYSGTISDCSACHKTMPKTSHRGPHGMHAVSNWWVDKHGDYAEDGGYRSCAKCHGSDYKGSSLSKTFTKRNLKIRTYQKDDIVSCYDCHNGPKGKDD